MVHISRRTLLASISSSVLFAAGPAQALTCDISRPRQNGISTRSYDCQIGEGQSLSATFVRMSDMVADSIGSRQLPGGYDAIISGSQPMETKTLGVLEGLIQDYSFAFEPETMRVNFDGREDGAGVSETAHEVQGARFRTLGVWDNPYPDKLPFFPLPDELRRAMSEPTGYRPDSFLRFANRNDFNELTNKKNEYFQMWRDGSGRLDEIAQSNLEGDFDDLGNLNLMKHIDAGAIDGFLPLYYSPMHYSECTGNIHGGAHFAPPALYVDAAVFRNTGTIPLEIEDFFGADDTNTVLRRYSPETPAGETRLHWRPIELAPGESVVAIQRLLFAALPQLDENTQPTRWFQRAIFGPAQLPKGIIMNGESFPFDGRSHNSLIVSSYAGKGSCPYLSSWCDQAKEWVQLGKVLTHCNKPELEGEDSREFLDKRTRFKLVEREHERTTLRFAELEVEMRNGEIVHLEPANCIWPVILDIGQMIELNFTIPDDLHAKDMIKTRLRLRGYYVNYQEEDVQRCKQVALA